MIIYIFLFAVSLILTYVLTPLVIPLAERVGAVDVPAERKVHQISVPRLGGLAVVAALYGSLLLGCNVFKNAQRDSTDWRLGIKFQITDFGLRS